MEQIGLKQNGRFYYGWLLMLVGFVMMLVVYCGSISITSIFVIPVTESLGVDRAVFLTYQTILLLVGIGVTLYFGKRMARGNIKRIVVLSMLAGAIGYTVFANAQSVFWFYGGAILVSFAYTNGTVLPLGIILNNWFGGKIKGTVVGFCFVGSGIGGLILLPVVNRIISEHSWQMGYYALAVLFAGIGVLSLLTLVKTPEEKGFTRMGQAKNEKDIKNADGMMSREAIRTPMYWLIFLSIALSVVGSSAVLFNAAPFYVECGLTGQTAALIASANLGMLALGKILCGFLCDRFGTKFGAIFTAVVFCVQFVCLAMMPTNPGLWVWGAVICYGIGAGGITVCPPLLVNALFGEKDYGSILAWLTMGVNVGGAFGGTIAAAIYDATGSYVSFWWMAVAATFLVVILRIVSFRLRKKYSY